MTRIYLDAMGGDNAPKCTAEGAIEALRADSDLRITLGGDGTFLSQESTKEPVCDLKVSWMKTGKRHCRPVAGKIRVSGSAQAPSVPLNISPMVWLRQPCADLRSACHGGAWLGAEISGDS